MSAQQLVNLPIKYGDVIKIEHTCVDRREYISAIVSHSCINNGKGVAVFHTDSGEMYLWKPSKTSPHGTVDRVDSSNEDYLINPYVLVYHAERDVYRPVDSSSGTYFTYQ